MFNVLRALGYAMRSTSPPESIDPEKGRLEQATVSPPAHDGKPQSIFAPPTLSSPRKLLLPVHKMSGSVTSRGHSPSSSVEASELSVSPALVQKPIASILDGELVLPPQALQKETHATPQLHLFTETSFLRSISNSTGLTPSPRRKRSPISSDLSPILGFPTTDATLQSTPPFEEAAQHSPATDDSHVDIGWLVNMYLSDASTPSVELPRLPAPAVQRGSSAELPPLNVQSSVSSTTSLPATSSVEHSLVVPPEGAICGLRAYVSVGAVGGGQRPPLTPLPPSPAPLTSPADSSDVSQYSDSEATLSPPTRPLRLNRSTSADTQASAARDRKPLEQPRVLRAAQWAPHSLPITPGLPASPRTPGVRLHTTSSLSSRSRGALSPSSHRG
jgi:hypothetical protein